MASKRALYCALLLAVGTVVSCYKSRAVRSVPCVPADCSLPTCHCASTENPGNFPVYDTPQIVNIVVEEGIRKEDYEYYVSLFSRKNPNQCPFRGTFMVTHNYTDYTVVENLYYTYLHEVGDGTVTQQSPASYWEDLSIRGWMEEIADQRTILNYWGNIPFQEVRGFRAPFLITTDNELQALFDLQFLYDATMHSTQVYYPFTFDYQTPLCSPPDTCPTNSYPGLWEYPAIEMYKANGQQCETLPECKNTTVSTQAQWYDLLRTNFHRHYYGNRAPFGIYFDPQLFSTDNRNAYYALSDFLDDIEREFTDAYVVTLGQSLQWMQDPQPLSRINYFEPWHCPQRGTPRCTPDTEKQCGPYKVETELRYFHTCNEKCPFSYPTRGNPYGTNP